MIIIAVDNGIVIESLDMQIIPGQKAPQHDFLLAGVGVEREATEKKQLEGESTHTSCWS